MPSSTSTTATRAGAMGSVVHGHQPQHTEKSSLLSKTPPTTTSYDGSKRCTEAHQASVSSLSLSSRIRDVVLSPFHEACYISNVFKQSMQAPTWPQAISGLATKGPVFVFSLTAWTVLLLPSHILPFICITLLSLCLESFHGIFVASWLNVQHLIEQTRGVGYQVLFNLTYIQFTGALFRLCAWAALPESTIPPWSLKYWRDVSVVTLIGTFFGVLGYNGINCLHRKGVLSDNVRAYVQHGRDVFMLVNGVYFSAGRMTMYWCVFAVQQGLDAGLYVVGRNVRPRAGSIAEREESIEGEEEEAGDRSVVREALQAAVSPFVAVGGVVKRVFVGIVGGGKEEVDRDGECDRVMSSSTETLV